VLLLPSQEFTDAEASDSATMSRLRQAMPINQGGGDAAFASDHS